MSLVDTKESALAPRTSAKLSRKASAKAKAATPATAVNPGAPSIGAKPQDVVPGPVMRKKELIDKVVEKSGMKRKDAKPAVEAVLGVLGEALGQNRELALPPMGKIKVRRERQLPNGRMMVVKIRQSHGPKAVSAAPEHNPDTAE